MITDVNAELIADAKASIGEGPAWDTRTGTLLWVDIPAGDVYETSPVQSGWSTTVVGSSSGPVGAVVPRASGGYVVAAGTSFAALDRTGAVRTIAEIPASATEVRLNDGKCDPAGRFWAGTQPLDGTQTRQAALYCLDHDGSVRTMIDGVSISNGLGWSPDGERFYYIDTPTLGVDVFDVDPEDGSLHNRERLIDIEFGHGRPDGLCVDDDGYLWVALVGSGTVRRYAPDGSHTATVRTSAPLVTSCAFGGPGGDTLFITSMSLRLPPEHLRRAGLPPSLAETGATAHGAGGLFAVQPGVCGTPAVSYAG